MNTKILLALTLLGFVAALEDRQNNCAYLCRMLRYDRVHAFDWNKCMKECNAKAAGVEDEADRRRLIIRDEDEADRRRLII